MKKIFAVFIIGYLSTGVAYAATIGAGAGSYTDSLPAGKPGPQSAIYKTSNISGPIPTNDWWTSMLASATPYRMFAFPQCYKWNNDTNGHGLLIGYPSITKNPNSIISDDTFIQELLVEGLYNGTSLVTPAAALVDGYSDWTVTTLWKDQADPTKYLKATFGHGLLFTYFDFSDGVTPRISFPFDWSLGQFNIYNEAGALQTTNPIAVDHITVEFTRNDSSRKVYYGIFAPTGSLYTIDGNPCHRITITLPAGQNYVSIGLMTSKDDLASWKQYAYAFVTNTQVHWNVDTAKSSVQTDFSVTTSSKQGGQTTTLLALFPHQWKHASITALSQSFVTLRGIMKVVAGNSFSVTNSFQGAIPFLPDRGSDDTTHLRALLGADSLVPMTQTGTYFHGKELCRLANLIPIASELSDYATLNLLGGRLESDLVNWYTYTPGEDNGYFYYNANWGSLIGYNPEFGLENFTDQHFHFGYFIYASSILSLYDKDFISKYGPMVELLIRSFASPDRSDTLFPFLRTFDPYEGHSWADGRALSVSGNNQESSSEAMNAWAGIYLWGIASGNTTYRDLGIWGYTTEYSAIREYYFDIDGTQYGGGYLHDQIGILWGGEVDYATFFGSQPEDIHGIEILPQNPSMLYLGYDNAYAQANYNQMVAENGGLETTWQDTFWKFQSLFDPASALSKFNESITYDSSNSKTLTYHWLHDFDLLGTVDISIYADSPSYGVFSKSGQKTYTAINASDVATTVSFFRFSDNGRVGAMPISPHTMVSTNDFSTFSVESLASFTPVNTSHLDIARVYPNPYRPGSGGDFDRRGGILFANLTAQAKIRIYTIAGELVFEGESAEGTGRYEWNASNNGGQKVASGVYVYVITNPSGDSKTGKLAIIK